MMSKSRVAPVKTLTLPQLELMAAVNRFATYSTLKRFIANRVKEINQLTGMYVWKYCPTMINPADLLTPE